MPRRGRSYIGRRSRNARSQHNSRRNASQKQIDLRSKNQRERNARSRSGRSPEQRSEQNERDRIRMERNRAVRERTVAQNINLQRRIVQNHVNIALNGAGFRYVNAIDYSMHKSVIIGEMNKICQYCHTFKFETEISGMCCASGKVRLRIPMIPQNLPFDFKRLQFPIQLAFAITINKAQGQSLELCGIDLEYPCFSHDQLYVGCSRVGKPSVLFIFTTTSGKTKNVVYERALQQFKERKTPII